VKFTPVTLLIQEIAALIDTGLYDGISVQVVRDHIKQGDVLRFLGNLGGTDVDFSVLLSNTYGDFEAWYEEQLQAICAGYGGDEKRKWGIENRGLCLLLAWTAEMIQLATRSLEMPRRLPKGE
jgi:hypothetical protein